jgi:acetyl esterase/lipase
VASPESQFLTDLYQTWAKRLADNPEMDLPTMTGLFEEWHLATPEPEGVSYAEADADGVPATWCLPDGAAADRAILYLHGGGFAVGSRHSHRKLVAHLAKATGVRGLVIDYRVAPANPFPAGLDDCVKAYRWLRAQGFTDDHLATAGDSAGGNLAIAVPLKLAADGDAVPAATVAYSPFLDLECTGDTLDSNAAVDAIVSKPILQVMSSMLLGESQSPRDPLANPLHADLSVLPPTYVTTGGYEGLLADSVRFVEQARAAGVDAHLDVVAEMQHVFPFLVGRAPEGDAAVAASAAFLRPRLGL